MQPWQRFNQLPNFHEWEYKDSFASGMRAYAQNFLLKPDMEFLPLTYVLHKPEDAKEVLKQLKQQATSPNTARPWVFKLGNKNRGEGVQIIGPHTPELQRIQGALEAPGGNSKTTSRNKKTEDNKATTKKKGNALSYLNDEDLTNPKNKCLMQHYICRELSYQQRKFDIRAYWLVASVDPLIVLFHHGLLRVGNNVYNETDFSNPQSHLTTHTYRKQEMKLSWKTLESLVQQHYQENKSEMNRHLSQEAQQDPFAHVENQMKSALTHMIHAFRETSFNMNGLYKVDNGFANYGVDFVLDQDLDVWMIEAQVGAGLNDKDGVAPTNLNTEMIPSIIDMVEEVQEKQSRGQKVMPLESKGEWQLIYDSENDYSFRYDYPRRQDKPGCSLAQ